MHLLLLAAISRKDMHLGRCCVAFLCRRRSLLLLSVLLPCRYHLYIMSPVLCCLSGSCIIYPVGEPAHSWEKRRPPFTPTLVFLKLNFLAEGYKIKIHIRTNGLIKTITVQMKPQKYASSSNVMHTPKQQVAIPVVTEIPF